MIFLLVVSEVESDFKLFMRRVKQAIANDFTLSLFLAFSRVRAQSSVRNEIVAESMW